MVQRAAFAAILAVCATLAATAAGGAELDVPRAEQHLVIPDPSGDASRGRTITCDSYAGFMVRTVHEGQDVGTAAVSVAPVSAPPACGAARLPGERDLPDNGGMELYGVRGRFILLLWPDGFSDTTAFAVFDAMTARKLYADTVRIEDHPLAAPSLDAGGDVLSLHFQRAVIAKCSLAGIDSACWSQVAREAKLPGEIARRKPPTAQCAAAYAAQKLTGKDLQDPSVIAYPVDMTLSAEGKSAVLSRGALSCWPAA